MGRQVEVLEKVKFDAKLHSAFGAPFKRGILIVSPYGGGKTQTLTALREAGYVKEANFLSPRSTTDLKALFGEADLSGFPAVALDNPDLPVGGVKAGKALASVTRLLAEAAEGRTPYLIITLSEPAFGALDPFLKAELVRAFWVVKLKWGPGDLERAVINKLKAVSGREAKGEALREAVRIARTPRSALLLYLNVGLAGGDPVAILIERGLLPTFEEYVSYLGASGGWAELWREVLGDREVAGKLIEGRASRGDLTAFAERAGYKVMHWVVTVPLKYGVIKNVGWGLYGFGDDFLSLAVERACLQEVSGYLKYMAELRRLPPLNRGRRAVGRD